MENAWLCRLKPGRYTSSTSHPRHSYRHTLVMPWLFDHSLGRRTPTYVALPTPPASDDLMFCRSSFPLQRISDSSCTMFDSLHQASLARALSRRSPVTLHGCSAWIFRQTRALRCQGELLSLPSVSHICSLRLYRSADKSVKVWDLSARAAVSTTQETGEVWSVSWRPRPAANNVAGAFVTGGDDGIARWYRAAGAA